MNNIKKSIALISSVLFLSFSFVTDLHPKETSSRVIAEFDSFYNKKIIVAETGNIREMLFDSASSNYIQGTVNLNDTSILISSYLKGMMIPIALIDSEKLGKLNVLAIGLGTGSIPRFLRKNFPDMNIDAVEIDPVVVKVSKKYFDVKEDSKYRIFTADGKEFLKNTEKRYDLIFLDAFGPGDGGKSKVDDIPRQLTTIEFFTLAESKLSDIGILVSNYIFVNQEHYSSFHLSHKKNFPLVYRFPIKYSREASDYNIILVAHKKYIPEFNKNYLIKKINDFKIPLKTDPELLDYIKYFNNDQVDEGKSALELHDE